MNWILDMISILIGLLSFFILLKLWSHHKQFCEIVTEANQLLESMKRHEHKLNIMTYTLERRLDHILDEEKNSGG